MKDSNESRKSKKKVCMISYIPHTFFLPSMHNEGISLSQNDFVVEAICTTNYGERPPFEVINEGFTISRVLLRSRDFFHTQFGVGSSKNFIIALQYVFTYMEFLYKSFLLALRSSADLYESHDLPTLLPGFLAAFIRRKPLIYHAH